MKQNATVENYLQLRAVDGASSTEQSDVVKAQSVNVLAIGKVATFKFKQLLINSRRTKLRGICRIVTARVLLDPRLSGQRPS